MDICAISASTLRDGETRTIIFQMKPNKKTKYHTILHEIKYRLPEFYFHY